MNYSNVLTIAKKELRSYFLSPVALIFLGVFLTINLFIFFKLRKKAQNERPAEPLPPQAEPQTV